MSAIDTPPLPSFLIIGAQKSATRWLRMHLGKHPEIFTADTELAFFNKSARFEQGLDWYRTKFEGWNGEPIVGEATPAYMMLREDPARTATRIDESLPGVRLIALLRNPVDRTYSAFIHHMQRGRIPANADLLERVRNASPKHDKLGLIAGGWYAASLTPYFARFGERLRVFLHDDIAENPQQTYTNALEHVGASPGFLPTDLQRVRHSGKPPETSPYAEDGSYRRKLTPEEQVEIYAYFRRDVERLEELLDRDLSIWRPLL
jgi:hypothetical protein